MKTVIGITGMHCSSCKALIEDVCKDVAGVVACSVDLSKGKAVVEHEPTLNLPLLKQEIEAIGSYQVLLPT
jgi:copper chaperone CopZ